MCSKKCASPWSGALVAAAHVHEVVQRDVWNVVVRPDDDLQAIGSVVARTADAASANERTDGAASAAEPTATEASAPPTQFKARISSDSIEAMWGG